jgi:hypothetical protein
MTGIAADRQSSDRMDRAFVALDALVALALNWLRRAAAPSLSGALADRDSCAKPRLPPWTT